MDRIECVDISCCELVGTGYWDELEDQACKDVEHRTKGDSTKDIMGLPLRKSSFRLARI